VHEEQERLEWRAEILDRLWKANADELAGRRSEAKALMSTYIQLASDE
jgi:hypothetical protein